MSVAVKRSADNTADDVIKRQALAAVKRDTLQVRLPKAVSHSVNMHIYKVPYFRVIRFRSTEIQR